MSASNSNPSSCSGCSFLQSAYTIVSINLRLKGLSRTFIESNKEEEACQQQTPPLCQEEDVETLSEANATGIQLARFIECESPPYLLDGVWDAPRDRERERERGTHPGVSDEVRHVLEARVRRNNSVIFRVTDLVLRLVHDLEPSVRLPHASFRVSITTHSETHVVWSQYNHPSV